MWPCSSQAEGLSPRNRKGGKVLAEQSLASLWLDVHVSESTDTKDEKAVPIGNGEFMERPASTKTACPSDWTPYDFPT
jgi:hypothetical protein